MVMPGALRSAGSRTTLWGDGFGAGERGDRALIGRLRKCLMLSVWRRVGALAGGPALLEGIWSGEFLGFGGIRGGGCGAFDGGEGLVREELGDDFFPPCGFVHFVGEEGFLLFRGEEGEDGGEGVGFRGGWGGGGVGGGGRGSGAGGD